MTFRERLQKEQPECVDDLFAGGCRGCPCEYGYESEEKKPCRDSAIKCVDCWAREIPGTESIICDNLHKKICKELTALYERKNHDYGDSFHKSYEEWGLAMSAIRIGDKYNRFCKLIKSDAEVKDESIRDTLIDLANYAIMTVMELDKEKEHEN